MKMDGFRSLPGWISKNRIFVLAFVIIFVLGNFFFFFLFRGEKRCVSSPAKKCDTSSRSKAKSFANGTKQRVLITGISGMIGSHVARALIESSEDDVEVFGIVRPRSNLDTLIGILDKVTLLTGDITDKTNVRSILDQVRPHYLYHFAAQAINGISYKVPELTMETNVQGTLNFLESIVDLNLQSTRILLAGSSTEYGRTADVWFEEGKGAIPETAPFEPVSPYGVSKVSMELLGKQYFLTHKLQVFTARYFIQVGVGGTDSLAIHEFCKQIAMAELGLADPVVLHGNLKTKRDMTDARDSAPATIQLMKLAEPGEAYNVASGVAFSIESLLDMAVSMANVEIETKVDPARFRLYDEKVLLGDNKKLRKLTGWKPNPDLKDSVATILNYWRRKISYRYAKKTAKLTKTNRVGSTFEK